MQRMPWLLAGKKKKRENVLPKWSGTGSNLFHRLFFWRQVFWLGGSDVYCGTIMYALAFTDVSRYKRSAKISNVFNVLFFDKFVLDS